MLYNKQEENDTRKLKVLKKLALMILSHLHSNSLLL